MKQSNTREQLGLENPYQDTIYAGGGNVKASDGLVLGEKVALEMGGGVDDAHLISILSSETPKDVQVHNYAHAFARTDFSPMLSEELGIGVKQQLNSFMQRADYYKSHPDVDVILASGGNDLYAIFSEVDEIKEVISTKNKKDNKKFVVYHAKSIARNIRKTVRQLDDIVDEIAVAGMTPMMELPDSQDWLTNFTSEDQTQAAKLISKIGKKITRKLQKSFESNSDVHVNNGYELFGQVESPSFVDGFHPDSETSLQMAKLFVNEMTENFDTFGF